MTAFAVSEHGNKKLNNMVRTLFCHHPKNKMKSMDTWVNVPKKETIPSSLLFASDLLTLPSAETTKKWLESLVKSKSVVLTLGQRCCD